MDNNESSPDVFGGFNSSKNGRFEREDGWSVSARCGETQGSFAGLTRLECALEESVGMFYTPMASLSTKVNKHIHIPIFIGWHANSPTIFRSTVTCRSCRSCLHEKSFLLSLSCHRLTSINMLMLLSPPLTTLSFRKINTL